ncbi:MAG: hypothetical protein JWM95_1423 [Gemmatimonadetes bacterium]|nr:hypothetical protein [Gemmatimonadota bacterium]
MTPLSALMRRLAIASVIAAAAAIPMSAQKVITVRADTGGLATVAPGVVFAVPIVIDMSAAGGTNIASLTATVAWGPTRLAFDSLKVGTFGTVTANTSNAAAGTLVFSVVDPSGTTATVTVGTLYFTTASGSTSVTVTPTAAGNALGTSIFPLVRARWLNTCVAPNANRWGDASGDGTVNIIDAQQLARASVGLSVANASAIAAYGDVNNDAVVNVIDAQQVARYTVGLGAVPRVNTLQVAPAAVTSITVPHIYAALGGSLDPSTEVDPGTLALNGQAQLRPVALDAGNTDVTACAALTYSSNHPGVVTVAPTGLLTRVAAGSATITIAAGAGGASTTLPLSQQYTITATVSPAGAGTVTGTGTFPSGTDLFLTEHRSPNFAFVGWVEDGRIVSTAPTREYYLERDYTVVARYQPADSASAAVSASPAAGGSVYIYGDSMRKLGDNVTVWASPTPGYNFTNWTESGVVVSTTAIYSYGTTGDRVLVAHFVPSVVGVQILSPSSGSPIYTVSGDTLSVSVRATSLYAVASATAAVMGRTVALAPTTVNGNIVYAGTLNLSGLPVDTLAMTASVTDANGAVGLASAAFIHDAAPVVTVSAPADLTVARPFIAYAATCADDNAAGCTSFTLSVVTDYTSTVVASGTGTLSNSFTLGAYEGQKVKLEFRGTDSRGQTTSVIRSVYVESSTHLSAVGTAGGKVLDADGTKAVYERPSDGGSPVALRTFSSGTDATIAVPSSYSVVKAFVTPLGAILTAGQSVNTYLYDWRSGALTVSPQTVQLAALDVNANYATYVSGGVSSTYSVYRRDLTTGSDITVTTLASNVVAGVAADGSVAFTNLADHDAYWYHGGTITRVTNDAGSVTDLNTRTDGTNVVFNRVGLAGPNQVDLFDGTTETLLAELGPEAQTPGYVNGGWTAFTKPDASLVMQVWTRSPAGVLRQVSNFSGGSGIEGLNTDGSVVFTAGGRRYRAGPSSAPQDVGGSQGSAVWRNGQFYLLLGRTVWSITP